MTSRERLLALLPLLVGLLCGCPSLVGGQGSVPEGHRLISGWVKLPEDGIVGRQVTGLQVAAVAVVDEADGRVPKLFVSDVFDPADRRQAASFALAVPFEHASSIVLMVPSASGRGPGSYLGALRFSTGYGKETALLPHGEETLDLGVLRAIDGDPASAADNRLEVESASHPLGQVHHDDDGVSDLLDDDDDDDGVLDAVDEDVAGDGIEDALQSIDALPDEDASGIPDAFEA